MSAASLMYRGNSRTHFEFTFSGIEAKFSFVHLRGDSRTFLDHHYLPGVNILVQFLQGSRLMTERNFSPETLCFCTSLIRSEYWSWHISSVFDLCMNKGCGYLGLIDICVNWFHWLMKSDHQSCCIPHQIDPAIYCFIIIKHNLGFIC